VKKKKVDKKGLVEGKGEAKSSHPYERFPRGKERKRWGSKVRALSFHEKKKKVAKKRGRKVKKTSKLERKAGHVSGDRV